MYVFLTSIEVMNDGDGPITELLLKAVFSVARCVVHPRQIGVEIKYILWKKGEK